MPAPAPPTPRRPARRELHHQLQCQPPVDRARLSTALAELHDAPWQVLAERGLALLPSETPRDLQRRRRGVRELTVWLAGFPGQTWQARWVASGADHGGGDWCQEREHNRRTMLFKGAETLICSGVLHPDYPWLLANRFQSLLPTYERVVGGELFARVRAAAAAHDARAGLVREVVGACCRLQIANAQPLSRLGTDHVLAYDAIVRKLRGQPEGHETLWRVLRELGILPASAPLTLRAARHPGQASIEELVDRYQLQCRPVRDLLVTYLAERAPALDYTSLDNVAFWLAKLFWQDLERHHPSIDSLRLAPEIARAWKQRLAVRDDGTRRHNRGHVLVAVRAFYQDLNHWAYEDPARWAVWAAPCPVTKTDLAGRRKQQAERTARMHARTRTLAPLLPRLVATAQARLEHATALLAAARQAEPGTRLQVDATAYERLANRTRHATQVLVGRLPTTASDPGLDDLDGKPLDAAYEEFDAFWAWAAIEVMRLSGLRIEEVLELTHLSIRRYTQPDGEVVPLLQVAPSKTETERVFPISPELAHVLAQIVNRVRSADGTIPLTSRYDVLERTFSPELPHLFQRRYGGNRQVFDPSTIRNWLGRTLARADLRDVDGRPVRITPHDFRRLFTTEVVNSGLPIHIAAAVLGHRTVDTTRGYAAIYPETVIRAYQSFLQARRAHRPSEEYREPTDAEWAEFEQHFTLRKVALGNCDRPYGTPCIHEHACARCPMLRPEPSRLPVFAELEANLDQRLAEARERVWLGEVSGLEQTLQALRGKRRHAQRLADQGLTDVPVPLG